MYKFDGKSFYPYSLKPDYEAAGSWPESGKDISDETHAEFSQQPPYGMALGKDGDGYPCWMPLPPPTPEEILVATESKRKGLIAEVDAISPVKWAGMEEADQAEWVAYRKALVAMPSQEGYPDKAIWPAKPEVTE